jgi:fibrillarin-like pre-rRNA processing protein
MERTKYAGVYRRGRSLYTRTRLDSPVYGERMLVEKGRRYRQWDPRRSKLAAALLKGLKRYALRPDSRVLYLGAGAGTTVSHVADIASDGKIYAVEYAPLPFMKLLMLAKRMENVFPIMDDARYPERYEVFVGRVDIIYQDVAQRDQVRIFRRNWEFYGEAEVGYLFLKTSSVDVTKPPAEVMKMAVDELKPYRVVERLNLNPYEKNHYLLVVER